MLCATIATLPLHEPVGIACEIAFWRNLGLPVSNTDEPTPDESNAH